MPKEIVRSSLTNETINSMSSYMKNLDNRAEKIKILPIDQLIPFREHTYRTYSGKKLDDMAEEIRERGGPLEPIMVRFIDTEEKYEIIAGHNRTNAYRLLATKYPDEDWNDIPARIVKPTDDDAATLMMILSNAANYQHQTMPSDKAKCYSKLMEVYSRKGFRSDIRADGTEEYKGKTTEYIGKLFGDSYKTVERYLKCSNLIEDLLYALDDKRLSFATAIEIASLTKESQQSIYEYLTQNPKAKLTVNIAKDLVAEELNGFLDTDTIKDTIERSIYLTTDKSYGEQQFEKWDIPSIWPKNFSSRMKEDILRTAILIFAEKDPMVFRDFNLIALQEDK